jgi:hypothetical protein
LSRPFQVLLIRHVHAERDAARKLRADQIAMARPFGRHAFRALVVVDGLARRRLEAGEIVGQRDVAQLRARLREARRRVLHGMLGLRLGQVP